MKKSSFQLLKQSIENERQDLAFKLSLYETQNVPTNTDYLFGQLHMLDLLLARANWIERYGTWPHW